MVSLQEIEDAVSRLSRAELARFRDWFDKFDATLWDRQFERDAESGKLNQIADQAIEDYQAGKAKQV